MLYRLNILNEQELSQELRRLGCDWRGIKLMADKLSFYTIKIIDIPGYIGLIIKETALSCGADFALPREAIKNTNKSYDGILLANKSQIKKIISKLKVQAFKFFNQLVLELRDVLLAERIKIPQLMGVLNVTPDSFSDGGKFLQIERALAQAKKMIKAGAKIIDIGGESTRPGAGEISLAEELKRTIPVIKALRKINKKILISIDSTKSQVAEAAAKAGANIINDISGLNRDIKLAKVAAKYKTKLILMHRLAPSKTMQNNPQYKDVLKEIIFSLSQSIQKAIANGVKRENIIIDPGIGFGKTTEHNLFLIKNLIAFKALGCPVMLGASRKSVIGNILKNQPQQRLAGTIAASICGQLGYVDYLRVHDVQENLEALKVFRAIW